MKESEILEECQVFKKQLDEIHVTMKKHEQICEDEQEKTSDLQIKAHKIADKLKERYHDLVNGRYNK